MSIWFYKKRPEGRKDLYLIDIPITFLTVIVGLAAALTIPRYLRMPSRLFSDGAYLIGAGFILFLISKLSLLMQGIRVSWGYRLMKRPFKMAYILGYSLIAIGLLLILIGLKGSV